MRLYKAFNRIDGKLTSNYGDETYEVGGTYTLGGDKPIELCKWGYHGCPIPFDCFRYHEDEELRMLTEIEVHGGLLKGTEDDSHKACFRSFTIVREVDPSTISGMFENFDGIKQWYREGKFHREDGPAVEWPDGTKEWYREGELHREDGPAVEWPDGTKWWYREGKRHREGGPAVEWPDGTKYWYRNGERHREGGPAVEWASGTKWWYHDGKRHREDGPAIEEADGTKYWYKNGESYNP